MRTKIISRSTTSIFFSLVLLVLLNSSCEKFLDVGAPLDRVSATSVYSYRSSAAAVLTGIYHDMQRAGGIAQGRNSISLYCAASADELNVLPNSPYYGRYTNNTTYDFWSVIYPIVYRTNAALEGIQEAKTLPNDVKKQLEGEARFVRAFCYFYLVNLYGDVPLLLTSDYKSNAKARRTAVEDVYRKIIDDLLVAKELLTDKYYDGNIDGTSIDRVRPNKWAAVALLARVYLFAEQWQDAVVQATEVINNADLYSLVQLADVFTINSKEAIWQMESLSEDGLTLNTLDAKLYIPVNGRPNFANPIWVGDDLLNAFEVNDERKEVWLRKDSSSGVAYFYFYKYKKFMPNEPRSELLMALRLSEQYLIRAEAQCYENHLDAAKKDLDVIRQRAGLESSDFNTRDEILTGILHERRVEFFIEWGHRWLDLKRTKRVDAVMSQSTPKKGGVWQSFKQWYPIPLSDLRSNKNLTQNEGYPSL